MATDKGQDSDDRLLASYFDAARASAPAPDARLMARVLADAEAVAAARRPAARPRPARTVPGLLALIGGWPAASGLALATCAGLAIGFASPDTVTDYVGLSDSVLGADLAPDLALLIGGEG